MNYYITLSLALFYEIKTRTQYDQMADADLNFQQCCQFVNQDERKFEKYFRKFSILLRYKFSLQVLKHYRTYFLLL